MTDTPPKLCIDCKHYFFRPAGTVEMATTQIERRAYVPHKTYVTQYEHLCKRSQHVSINPVDGSTDYFLGSDCHDQRRSIDPNHCGRSGFFWEKKDG